MKVEIYYPGPHGSGPTGTENPAANKQHSKAIKLVEVAFSVCGITFKRLPTLPDESLLYEIQTIWYSQAKQRDFISIKTMMENLLGPQFSVRSLVPISIVRARKNQAKKEGRYG